MPRLYFLLFILILAGLPAGCISSSQANENNTAVQNTRPANLTRIVPSNASSSCLSPALKMNLERAAHTATLLPDGRVLIAGGFREEGSSEIAIASVEVFDPATNSFTPTGDLNEPRDGHTATLLPQSGGRVLIVGGWNQSGRSSASELYDPNTGTFEYSGKLMAPRQGFTATLLKDGRVLIAGGDSARNTLQLTVELYDPATKAFLPAGNLNEGRMAHTATLLNDGRVLLVGGSSNNGNVLSSAELYNPDTGTFTSIGSANVARYKHSAVLLQDGNVLILGGSNQNDWTGKYNSAEIYNVKTSTFIKISDMNRERFKLADAAVLLADGNVLIGGGNRQIEIFDSRTQRFLLSAQLDKDYFYSVLTRLQTGHVLITGGYDLHIQPSDKAWLYCG